MTQQNPPNPQNPQNPNQRQIRLEIPATLNATYSNAVIVSQTNNEIVMDFIQILPNDPRARVQQRIVMTPTSAKLFLAALNTNLTRFEEKYGTINTPPTLADQLFSQIKPDDDNE